MADKVDVSMIPGMQRLAQMVVAVSVLASTAILAPLPAYGGCGCEKAPPDAASVRPNATYVGGDVTLFHPALQAGKRYEVVFLSGTDRSKDNIVATAINRRDLADGVYKNQLVVSVPPGFPIGPTALTVMTTGRNASILTEVDDAALTVVPDPIPVGSNVGTFTFPDFEAAVGRDGTVYVSLDLSGTTHARGIRAQAVGYPLRFTHNDVVFYNSQGFLMQLLGANMPGLYSLAAPDNANDSDVLEYARHEFNTYYAQHLERQEHEADSADGNWHLDGTPHIDHDHLILAIGGSLNGGATPGAGATPSFDLSVEVFSLFHHGVVGTSSVLMNQDTLTNSYNSATGPYGAAGNVGSQGDVRSNGIVALSQRATIDGNAAAAGFDIIGNAAIRGTMTEESEPVEFLPVSIPGDLVDLGSLSIADGEIRTVSGPGSYLVSNIDVAPGGELLIDNADGAVTLYVTGDVTISSKQNDKEGQITTVREDPEEFAIYVADGQAVSISGNGSRTNGSMYGVVFAPHCAVAISGQGQYFGAFIGGDVSLTGEAQVHFDTALREENGGGGSGGGGGGKKK